MKDQHSDITRDEEVLRRVLKDKKYGHYDPDLDQPIARNAFRPVENDKDGLSFYRIEYTSPSKVAQGRIPNGYVVAQIKVADIHAMGLTINPKPHTGIEGDTGPDGHCIIPELTYKNRKDEAMVICQDRLAVLASNNIVFIPPDNEEQET